jgi:predicted RNA binding protein YcfA (HicA-like mRNA interferase family)
VRLPRDLSSRHLVRALGILGYHTTRETGSHLRLTTQLGGEHHVTIPDHDALRVGTLAAILDEVAEHLGMERRELVQRLFG